MRRPRAKMLGVSGKKKIEAPPIGGSDGAPVPCTTPAGRHTSVYPPMEDAALRPQSRLPYLNESLQPF